MATIPLTGLKGGEPIGFLAAVGLLRVLSGRTRFSGAKLGWEPDGDWSALLMTESAEDNVERVMDELLEHMKGRSRFPTFSGQGPDPAYVPDRSEPWL